MTSLGPQIPMSLEFTEQRRSNKSMMTNRRCPIPLATKQALERAVRGLALHPTAVAYLCRSTGHRV